MRNKWQNLFCQAFRRFSVANAFVAQREALIPTPVCLALGNPFSCKILALPTGWGFPSFGGSSCPYNISIFFSVLAKYQII